MVHPRINASVRLSVRWSLACARRQGRVPRTEFKLELANGQHLCMDVRKGDSGIEIPLQLYECNETGAQAFHVYSYTREEFLQRAGHDEL